MRRTLYLLLLTTLLLTGGGCRRMAQRAAQKIHIEGIEQLRPQGLSAAEVVFRVTNGTGYKLQLNDAQFDVYYKGAPFLTIRLAERVEVPKRTTASIPTRWRIRIADPLTLLLVGRDWMQREVSQLTVDYTLEGRGGPVPVKRQRKGVPLSEFLRTFGVSLDAINSFIH